MRIAIIAGRISMRNIYVKVSCPELPESVRDSIYTVAVYDGRTPEQVIRQMQRVAKKRGLTATYTLSSREEHRASRAASTMGE
jgi:hypothetical protein